MANIYVTTLTSAHADNIGAGEKSLNSNGGSARLRFCCRNGSDLVPMEQGLFMPSTSDPGLPVGDLDERVDEWLALIRRFLGILARRKKEQFDRRVSVGDLLTERSDNAAGYGFGEGTTMYDNVLVRGDVKVGRNTWIGPGCVLDGTGGELTIGDWCSISAGAQIYTHHTVNRSISLGELPIDYAPTRIGNGVYIGPNSVIQMGVTIGDKAIIGANSFVNRDVPAGAKAFGSPARVCPPRPL